MFFNYPPEEYLGAKPMNPRRAISPILATVIIIAVTLVIAIGVIGWIMGIWGTFGSTESLQLYPDSYIDAGKKVLVLHVKNTGTAASTIQKIEIVGIESISSGTTVTTSPVGGTSGTTVLGSFTIGPGVDMYINVSLTGSYTSGTSYQVKVYTAAGNVYSIVVQAK